jgi:hypothetical protein
VSAAVPVFESVNTAGGLVVFSVTLLKLKLAGARDATGMAAVPVPVNEEVCGEPGASSVTMSVAVKFVAEVGVNVT